MQMTELSNIATQPSPTAAATSTASPASTAVAIPGPQEFIVLTRPVTIQVPYGVTTLAAGTKLPVVSRDASTVNVRYLEQVYPVPAAATESR